MNDTRIIDSRDLIAEMNDLQASQEAGEDFDAERLAEIQVLADAGIEDWQYGATLIRDDHFVEYAQQLADDLGLFPEGNVWPSYCIDWERAARELRMDYMAYEFDGSTYWVR